MLRILKIINPQTFFFQGPKKPFDHTVGFRLMHRARTVAQPQENQLFPEISSGVLRPPDVGKVNTNNQAGEAPSASNLETTISPPSLAF